eukprot:235906-Hanusia_phi.AAC.3
MMHDGCLAGNGRRSHWARLILPPARPRAAAPSDPNRTVAAPSLSPAARGLVRVRPPDSLARRRGPGTVRVTRRGRRPRPSGDSGGGLSLSPWRQPSDSEAAAAASVIGLPLLGSVGSPSEPREPLSRGPGPSGAESQRHCCSNQKNGKHTEPLYLPGTRESEAHLVTVASESAGPRAPGPGTAPPVTV